jgi:hypothetical protein
MQKSKAAHNVAWNGASSNRCLSFAIAQIACRGNSRYGGGSRRSCQVSVTIV